MYDHNDTRCLLPLCIVTIYYGFLTDLQMVAVYDEHKPFRVLQVLAVNIRIYTSILDCTNVMFSL
jgi:hypothetical protein